MIRVTILSLSTLTAAIVSAHALAPQVMPTPESVRAAPRERAALVLPLREMSAAEARRAAPMAEAATTETPLAPTADAPAPVN